MGCCFSEPIDFDGEVTLYHFDLHRAVGRGAFGKVRRLRARWALLTPRRFASLSTRSPKNFTPSSTSRKPSVYGRRLSPMLFKNVAYWRRYIRHFPRVGYVVHVHLASPDRPCIRCQHALRVPGRRELFLCLRSHAWRGPAMCVRDLFFSSLCLHLF